MDPEKKEKKTEKEKTKRIYRKKCRGGLDKCKNYIGNYKDVEGIGCCEQCDKCVDENPYDPYWEHMEQEFENSDEYKELEEKGLLEDGDSCDAAYKKYHKSYEPWPIMRRRAAKKFN